MYNMPPIKQEDIDKRIKIKKICRNIFIITQLPILIGFVLVKQYIVALIPFASIIIVYLYVKSPNDVIKTKRDNYIKIYNNGRLIKNCPIVYTKQITSSHNRKAPFIIYIKNDGTPVSLDCEDIKCVNDCVADMDKTNHKQIEETIDIVIDEATGYFYYDTCIDRISGNREEDFFKFDKKKTE